VLRATFHYMAQPTSIRLPAAVKERLDDVAAAKDDKPSSLAVRLIDEGLRMAQHPGIGFHDSAAHGRVACIAGGPDVAEVIDVLTGLASQGDQRVLEAAEWFGVHPSRVRAAMAYYTAFPEEIDREIDLRRRAAAELRARYEAEQALLE
jgi:predicted transcriptional regulator